MLTKIYWDTENCAVASALQWTAAQVLTTIGHVGRELLRRQLAVHSDKLEHQLEIVAFHSGRLPNRDRVSLSTMGARVEDTGFKSGSVDVALKKEVNDFLLDYVLGLPTSTSRDRVGDDDRTAGGKHHQRHDPPLVVVVSGDRDFGDDIRRLKRAGLHTCVIYSSHANRDFASLAHVSMCWDDLMGLVRAVAPGGGPHDVVALMAAAEQRRSVLSATNDPLAASARGIAPAVTSATATDTAASDGAAELASASQLLRGRSPCPVPRPRGKPRSKHNKYRQTQETGGTFDAATVTGVSSQAAPVEIPVFSGADTPSMNRIPCRFFLKTGGCRYGADCKFSHGVISTNQVTNSTAVDAPPAAHAAAVLPRQTLEQREPRSDATSAGGGRHDIASTMIPGRTGPAALPSSSALLLASDNRYRDDVDARTRQRAQDSDMFGQQHVHARRLLASFLDAPAPRTASSSQLTTQTNGGGPLAGRPATARMECNTRFDVDPSATAALAELESGVDAITRLFRTSQRPMASAAHNHTEDTCGNSRTTAPTDHGRPGGRSRSQTRAAGRLQSYANAPYSAAAGRTAAPPSSVGPRLLAEPSATMLAPADRLPNSFVAAMALRMLT